MQMALLLNCGVIGAQPWHSVAQQPVATRFPDKGRQVRGWPVLVEGAGRHNAAAICRLSLMEPERLCVRSQRVTRLCLPCVLP